MSSISTLAFGSLFCFVLMSLSWVVSQKLNFYSLVDAVWAYGFSGLVVIYFITSDGSFEKKILSMSLAMLWSLRLGTHLATRLKDHYPNEDRRYLNLKSKWAKGKFFIFFQLQALSQMIISLPLFFIAKDRSGDLSSLAILGCLVFVIGLCGETLSDMQLRNFRKDPLNSSRVCKVGLWKYSRHPNYFFEWLIWCGIAMVALQAPYGYIGLLSPIVMYFTLNYLTGIPALEEQCLRSKSDLYREYQKVTSPFFPRNSL